MNDCKNPTCVRTTATTYCSRACQLAMRTVSRGKALPDVWLPMSTWHRLHEYAKEEGETIAEVVKWAIHDLLDDQ